MTADPAEHPDHPHGSTVEQVHRILGQAYDDEPDRWMLAEDQESTFSGRRGPTE